VPQTPGALRAFPGLYRDFFTFYITRDETQTLYSKFERIKLNRNKNFDKMFVMQVPIL
jgi:hypothetical protein